MNRHHEQDGRRPKSAPVVGVEHGFQRGFVVGVMEGAGEGDGVPPLLDARHVLQDVTEGLDEHVIVKQSEKCAMV